MDQVPGKVTVAPAVLTTIVRLTALEQRGVRGFASTPPKVRGLLSGGASEEGIFVGMTDEGLVIEVHVMADSRAHMLKLGETLQTSITRAIEEMVGMQVATVNVHIDDVLLTPGEEE